MSGGTCADAIQQVVAAFEAHERRHFHVGIVGYFIEGTPLSADALLLDGDSAFDMTATDDGFTCFVMFPPRAPSPEIVSQNLVQTDPAGVEFVVVALEAKAAGRVDDCGGGRRRRPSDLLRPRSARDQEAGVQTRAASLAIRHRRFSFALRSTTVERLARPANPLAS